MLIDLLEKDSKECKMNGPRILRVGNKEVKSGLFMGENVWNTKHEWVLRRWGVKDEQKMRFILSLKFTAVSQSSIFSHIKRMVNYK